MNAWISSRVRRPSLLASIALKMRLTAALALARQGQPVPLRPTVDGGVVRASAATVQHKPCRERPLGSKTEGLQVLTRTLPAPCREGPYWVFSGKMGISIGNATTGKPIATA